jgi:hypothetical protein
MFTLFHDPFHYTPTYWLQPQRYFRPQSLFERYLDALDQRFFSILTDDAAELFRLEQEQQQQQQAKLENSTTSASPNDDTSTSTSTAHPDQPTESSDSKLSDKSKIEAKSDSRRYYGRQYISHTRSTFNGQDYVEEHREKVTGSNGETRIATRRRLGDRWYENEIDIDKDGKKTERETWHNVADEDIEKFKVEWTEKRGGKGQIEGDSVTQPQGALESGTPSSESHE